MDICAFARVYVTPHYVLI